MGRNAMELKANATTMEGEIRAAVRGGMSEAAASHSLDRRLHALNAAGHSLAAIGRHYGVRAKKVGERVERQRERIADAERRAARRLHDVEALARRIAKAVAGTRGRERTMETTAKERAEAEGIEEEVEAALAAYGLKLEGRPDGRLRERGPLVPQGLAEALVRNVQMREPDPRPLARIVERDGQGREVEELLAVEMEPADGDRMLVLAGGSWGPEEGGRRRPGVVAMSHKVLSRASMLELDEAFVPEAPLSVYLEAARSEGKVVTKGEVLEAIQLRVSTHGKTAGEEKTQAGRAIDALGLERRVERALSAQGIKTLDALLALSARELEGTPGLRRRGARRVYETLAGRQVYLKGDGDEESADPRRQSIRTLGMGRRVESSLGSVGVRTIGQLLGLSSVELARMWGLGRQSLETIKETLRSRGLELEGDQRVRFARGTAGERSEGKRRVMRIVAEVRYEDLQAADIEAGVAREALLAASRYRVEHEGVSRDVAWLRTAPEEGPAPRAKWELELLDPEHDWSLVHPALPEVMEAAAYRLVEIVVTRGSRPDKGGKGHEVPGTAEADDVRQRRDRGSERGRSPGAVRERRLRGDRVGRGHPGMGGRRHRGGEVNGTP